MGTCCCYPNDRKLEILLKRDPVYEKYLNDLLQEYEDLSSQSYLSILKDDPYDSDCSLYEYDTGEPLYQQF